MISGAASAEVAASNRQALAVALGFDEIIMPKLAHGGDIYVVAENYVFEHRPVADVIMTNQANQLIGVPTADCVAILIYDPVNKVVAAVHSGWRGTKVNVAATALARMATEFGSQPDDLIAYLSPAPQGREYEVGIEVAELFDPKYITFEKDRYWFDNKQTVLGQLLEAGVNPLNIEISSESSYQDKYHSYRRDGETSGRHVAVIGIKGLQAEAAGNH